jgi:hypothetical protein
MTVPARDLAIPVPCRVPACTSPRSYALRFTMPASAGPTFWWDPPSAATNVRTFADLYMDEVAVLVLVDADPDDLEPEAC